MSLQGGELLKLKLEALAKDLGEGKVLRAGFLEGATYPDGTPVALVAAANEFGDPGQSRPPRPFFRDAIEAGKQEWPAKFAKLVAVTKNEQQSLLLLGRVLQDDIQAAIRHLDDPPLAPSTIKRKGFANPLIDTAHMLNSVSFEVVDE